MGIFTHGYKSFFVSPEGLPRVHPVYIYFASSRHRASGLSNLTFAIINYYIASICPVSIDFDDKVNRRIHQSTAVGTLITINPQA